MAIRIRCENCRKKVSIDEAFEGGVCRCPYCGALNTVPYAPGRTRVPPARPDRPDTPGAAPGVQAPPSARAHAVVPTARPVLIQGVVALVLIVFLMLLLAFSGVFFYKLARPDDGPVAGAPVNPITRTGLVGQPVKTPLVYVLDGGSGTGPMFDLAAAAVRHSVRGLDPGDKFNVMFVAEGTLEKLGGDWTGGGEEGDRKLKTFLITKVPVGASDLDGAIVQAVGLSPKAVALLAGKAPADPAGVAEKARAAGVRIYAVSLGAYPDVNEAMKTMAEKTGGWFRPFPEAELQHWLSDAPALP